LLREGSFDALIADVHSCLICPRMSGSQRVLNRGAGRPDARVMFVGEAPGRLGADGSGVPFHGDKAGANFEELLEQVGLSRHNIFVTNAVLCNPKDHVGNNSPPAKSELEACSRFLRRQIDLVDPAIVVPLGGVALNATSLIENHGLNLREHVRQAHKWYGRLLVPIYHPGQRAMLHRSFANQLSDYQFIAEQVHRLGSPARSPSNFIAYSTAAVVDLITRLKQDLSYFALHKLFYLSEVQSVAKQGHRLTNSYIIRQKDGPYCTELHPLRLKKVISGLTISKRNSSIRLIRADADLFCEPGKLEALGEDATQIIQSTVSKYGHLTDSRLKTVTYLTRPMREILRSERAGRNMYNAPIDFFQTAPSVSTNNPI
jgi:uracil-DNA glycosylase family 4